jgi:hypothetical protein
MLSQARVRRQKSRIAQKTELTAAAVALSLLPVPPAARRSSFKSAASIFAVCEYCQSTLVRHDQALEDIGKMAALVEDRSPLQTGRRGAATKACILR